MKVDWDLVLRIVVPFVTLICGAAINRMIERRSKLISYLGHVSSFTIHDENRTQVFTHSIVLRNAGKKAATNVRIGHNVLPDYQVYPSISHTIEPLPDGSKDLVIPVLVPGEQVSVSYLYGPPLTWDRINTNAKSDDGFAKILNVIPTPQYSRLTLLVMQGFLLIGVATTVYLLITLGIVLAKAIMANQAL